MRVIACAAVGVALALAPGCGSGDPRSTVSIVGGNAEQRGLLASIADGLATTSVQRIAMRNIGVIGFPNDTWVELRVRSVSGQGRTLRGRWEGHLLAGAFRDRSADEQLADVRFVDLADGTYGIERRRRSQAPWPEPASAAERIGLARLVAQGAAEQRAAVEELTMPTPFAPAVVLIVTVDDPAAFVKHRFLPMVDRWWGDDRLEGGYVLVEDRDGNPVTEMSFATRLLASGFYLRPDLAGCDPTIHIGDPSDEPPPPCPAA
jgi:hypothetical protein